MDMNHVMINEIIETKVIKFEHAVEKPNVETNRSFTEFEIKTEINIDQEKFGTIIDPAKNIKDEEIWDRHLDGSDTDPLKLNEKYATGAVIKFEKLATAEMLSQELLPKIQGEEINGTTADKEMTQVSRKKTHRKVHLCDICNKLFRRLSNLKRHRAIHSGEKPHLCDVCSKSFSSSTNLFQHKSLIHAKEKPFSCDICGRTFSYKKELKLHHNNHTKEKPFPCDICDKAFERANHLNKHKLVHTGEKPHCCDICNKLFRRSEHLKTHKLIVHTKERLHICDTCGKSFHLPSGLRRHRLTHTDEKPFSCDVCSEKFSCESDLKGHIVSDHS